MPPFLNLLCPVRKARRGVHPAVFVQLAGGAGPGVRFGILVRIARFGLGGADSPIPKMPFNDGCTDFKFCELSASSAFFFAASLPCSLLSSPSLSLTDAELPVPLVSTDCLPLEAP